MISRILIYAVLFYVIFRIVKALMGQGSAKPNHDGSGSRSELENIMIKDPVCGIYFPKREGVVFKENGREIYFCSPECKDKYSRQGKE